VTIFVDTSALIAVLDADDARHADAAAVWRTIIDGGEPLLTTSYVLVETYALIQRRIGTDAVAAFASSVAPILTIAWIDESMHAAALAAVLAARRRRLSIVDCASFHVMRARGVDRAFTVDDHFAEQGFTCLPAPRSG
jgi:predicted nucleic acid-binding protein